MGDGIRISQVRFVEASPQDSRTGLCGWISCVLNRALRLDGLTLRRKRDGKLAISFPTRKDAWGRQHPIVQPLDDATRILIERQVLAALQWKGLPK